ncbi:MAG: TRAP transporter substrate-binding protein [Deferrisomatales bacterium]
MRQWKILATLGVAVGVVAFAASAMAQAKPNPLEKWKPAFDPSGAKYVMKVSNVSHPAIEGIGVGYKIRDELWKRTNGQLYFDYYPLSQLGGEVEVMNQLMMGAVQGMIASTVAAQNIGPRFGVVNLPFVVDSFDQLDKFTGNKELFTQYLAAAEDKGLMGVEVSGFGTYGWATVKPVRTIADAKPLKFRIAEAPVNQSLYKAWGMNAVVMPWPDVDVAMKQGVIDGLDHAAIVASITKKFEIAKYYTQLDYAPGLFVHLINKAWFNTLPADLQKTLVDVIREECVKNRVATREQEAKQIAAAKAAGVEFFKLSAEDRETLRKQGDAVHKEWADRMGADFLKKVKDFMGYKPI